MLVPELLNSVLILLWAYMVEESYCMVQPLNIHYNTHLLMILSYKHPLEQKHAIFPAV